MGHTAILRHLIEKGGNIWALDNQGQTPAMAAATRRRGECFKYLDSLSVRLQVETPGIVKKMQQKAIKEAEKRMKQLRKKQIEQNKHQTAVAKGGEGKKLGKKSKTVAKLPSPGEGCSESVQQMPTKASTVSGYRQRLTSEPAVSKPGGLKLNTLYRQVTLGNFVLKPASNTNEEDKPKEMMSFKSLDEIDFEHAAGLDAGSGHPLRRVGSTGSIRTSAIPPEKDNKQTAATIRGIFRNEGSAAVGLVNALSSLQDPRLEETSTSTELHSQILSSPKRKGRKRTTSGSLPDEQTNDADKFENPESPETSDETEVDCPLAAFLAALELEGMLSLLEQERMDLDALTLCSDSDLKEINVPMGPRRKIMAAVKRRQGDMQKSGALKDTSV